MSLTLTGINMSSQYTTNKLQSQITSQQWKIQEQQSEIQSQQQELQKYQTKVQQQEQQIQGQDSIIQTLQHEKIKKKSNTPSKQDALASLTQQDSKPLTYDAKSVRVNFDNMQAEIDKISKVQTQKMKIKQTDMAQRVQQAIQAYQANQISIQIPRLASMTMPLNLLA